MSIADDLENPLFPFDTTGPLYHFDGLVSIGDVLYCMEIFLHTEQEEAERIFLDLVSRAKIDIFSSEEGYCYSGVYRPATREGVLEIFDMLRNLGTDWLDWAGLIIMFSTEQIETMMNEGIKGYKQPFSIAHLITQKKAHDLLDQAPKKKGTKADRPLHPRERNTLLKIIAALAIELKIPLTDSYKSGMVIEALTDKLGEGVDHATIEMKIKDIRELVKLPSN